MVPIVSGTFMAGLGGVIEWDAAERGAWVMASLRSVIAVMAAVRVRCDRLPIMPPRSLMQIPVHLRQGTQLVTARP